MQVPGVDSSIWKAMVTGQKNPVLAFLAGKILLARLRLTVQNNPGAAGTAAAELHSLYAQNAQLQSVQKDLGQFGV